MIFKFIVTCRIELFESVVNKILISKGGLMRWYLPGVCGAARAPPLDPPPLDDREEGEPDPRWDAHP